MKVYHFSTLALLKGIGGVVLCLLLQGCGLWSGGNQAVNDWTPQSTVIAPLTDNSENDHRGWESTGSDYSSVSIKEALNPSSSSTIRALPRRPEGVEMEEEEFDAPPVILESEIRGTEPRLTMYVVTKGDTLSKIAHEFQVTIDQIVRENSLKNKNSLSIGQVLMIPESGYSPSLMGPSSVVTHTVQKGDTLSKLASQYHTTVSHLKVSNKLSGDKIRLGQKLKISQGSASISEKPVSRADMTPIVGEKYVVKAGDSLWTIAKRSGLTVKQLKEFNHLSSDVLMVGKELTLKAPTPVYVEPTVVPEVSQPAVSSQLLEDSISTNDFKQQESNLEEEDFEDLIDSGDDMPVSINYVR